MVWDIMSDEDEQMFVTGMLLLFDFSDYGMNHFTAMPLSMIKKLMPCWEVNIILVLKFNCYRKLHLLLFLFKSGSLAAPPEEYELHPHSIHL
jgi:hypothetical protein